MDIKELEQIIGILKQNDITEFELEHNGTHIRLMRAVPRTRSSGALRGTDVEPAIVSSQSGYATAATSSQAGAAAEIEKLTRVESPLVGTFYRKPSPEAEPFVKEGDVVKKGDTLCIIEAMKLMNEIEAPITGKIEKILSQDGQVVEYGEVLFLINPSV